MQITMQTNSNCFLVSRLRNLLCQFLFLFLFGCKRVLGVKGHFLHFLRKDLTTMFPKDLTGCFSHCFVECGDHLVHVCIFIVHDGERNLSLLF